MFEFKRKNKIKDIEAFSVLWFTEYYRPVVLGSYSSVHQVRNLFSRFGINWFIIGYCVIVLFIVMNELFVADPIWRHYLLIFLATQVIYDGWLNLEPFYISLADETENYSSERIFTRDTLTLEQRILKAQELGHTAMLKNLQGFAENLSPRDHIEWISEIQIQDKKTRRCWSVRMTKGKHNDYEDYFNGAQKASFFTEDMLVVFQEIHDRKMSLEQQQHIWNRLERMGVYVMPCY
ncbi:hypothetical protein CKO12_11710 [Chromatium okenii]|uniref:hypothetical protein n=1 Tax=Chromatium okenii TaxID=61644 RepID=UPI00190579FF|nr:hypothetical protein [Chromatium okenii]MBK1642532.1 hypothetical protein [Chromatium okenii]